MRETENKKPIKDNPSTKKLRDEMKSMSALIKVGKIFGLTKNSNVLAMGKMINDLDNLAKLPDEFNAFFAEKGWIAYEYFHVPTMQKAVEMMQKGYSEAAEGIILDYYKDISNIRMMIVSCGIAVEAYKPRKQLALYALDEYANGKYYSCVPLLLMIIDGVVNDISKETGFFADKTDVTSWDSIAGHYSGLTQLKKIYNKTRRKTNTDEITMPYRNGILHGRDLNYNNIHVAAKCWGCLAAILDWGKDIENGKKVAPPPENPKTFIENLKEIKSSIKSLDETQKLKKRIEKWEPRKIDLISDEMTNISSASLDKDTPEKCAIEFLEFWKKKNYGYMADLTNYNPKYESRSNRIKSIREIYENKTLVNYQITAIEDKALVITEISLSLEIQYDKQTFHKSVIFMMIYEGEKVIHGDKVGSWQIITGYTELNI